MFRLVLLHQLAKVPAAEGSHEAAQENEHNASLLTIIAERDVCSHRGGQREVGCHGADRYSPTEDRHIFLGYIKGICFGPTALATAGLAQPGQLAVPLNVHGLLPSL